MNTLNPINPIHRSQKILRWFGGRLPLLALLVGAVNLAPAQTPPALFTSAPTFVSTNHILSTTFFHWFPGQQTGPWRPLEGIANWNGTPAFWQGQIKQMMLANIDMLYVHQYADAANPSVPTTNFFASSLDQQLINFFTALNQLRAQGYDVPKIAPFLDPQITWSGTSIDLATTAGKDAWANQYIRFYNMYYSVNPDTNADDYLAKQSNKPILDTWTMLNVCQNYNSLTRADVSTRLVAALGAAHPCFTNGFVQVGCAQSPAPSFVDEKLYQFETNTNHAFISYNGVVTMQLKAGYWDQNIRTPGDFWARNGGLNYSNAWNYPDRNTITRANIETWNEYDEGTGIYAGTNSAPYRINSSTNNNDTWSTTGDPFEYIKTTARGAAIFCDVSTNAAKILWNNIPATLTPGETRTVTVIVRNAGSASWTAATNYKLGQADADATTLVAGKRVLINDTQDEIPLYGGIFRGRAKSFTFTITAPASLGNYTNHFQMIKEGAAWFGDTLTNIITVKTKTAATLVLTNLAQTYDGTAKAATAVTTPSGLTVNLTYNSSPYPPSAAGSYTVVGIIDDTNYSGSATNTLVITANPNLMWANGGFEASALGATVSAPLGGGSVIDTTTITGWRVFNVVPAEVGFSATIISNASAGSHAILLDVNNTSGTGGYALDQEPTSMNTPVQYGTTYVVSFDAAWVAGVTTNNLFAQVVEYNSGTQLAADTLGGSGAYPGCSSVYDTNYHTYKFIWTPTTTNTTGIGFHFSPMVNRSPGATTIRLDNVQVVNAANLPVPLNGSFEFQDNGTSVTATLGGASVVNTTTITGWRVFDVDTAHVDFRATIISNASAGSHAIRLAVTNTTGSGNYALDQPDTAMHTPVHYGTNYLVSFDAAWIAGATANNLLFQVQEFNTTNVNPLITDNLGFQSVSATGYHTYSFVWTPTQTNTTGIGFFFAPMGYVAAGTTTISLDNVTIQPIAIASPMNGNFGYSPIGTSRVETNSTIDTSTFLGWRLYNVAPIKSFAGMIVDAGSYAGGQPGTHAIRLDINNTNSTAGDYALDNDNSKTPVTTGRKYTLSFDLELDGVTGGAMLFQSLIAEFNAANAFTGNQSAWNLSPPTDQTFHHYSMDYFVTNPATTQVLIAFRPVNAGFISAVVLANVSLAPYAVTANTVTVYRATGSATQVKRAKIMSYEPLGLIFVTNSATTANGASLTGDTNTTINVPSGSVDDSFTYTVTDGSGYTNTGTVLVKVGAPTGSPAAAWPNGDFSASSIGVASGLPGPAGGVDATTLANWRIYSVGTMPITNFSGTIQDAAVTDGTRIIQGGVPGSHCIRLDVDNTGNRAYPNAVYALDRDNARIPVTYGVIYTLCFDAALYGATGSPFTLGVGLAEFNAGGAFDGGQTTLMPVLDGAYRTFAYSWTPLNPATTQIAPGFTPYSPGFVCAMGLANVSLHAPVAVNLATNRASGTALQLRIADLMAGATDTQNHPLTFLGTSATTTNGSTLATDGIYIYVPTNTVSDSFTYKITDGLGATNFATVAIAVTGGMSSTPTNIVYQVSGSTLSLTWPGSHLGWIAQSNSVNVADTNYWFPIAGSQSVTNLNLTISPATPKVFYRLRLP